MPVTQTKTQQVKRDAGYKCVECGSEEKVQGHHMIPQDDDSIIALCAECHSSKHPDIPKAWFFSEKNNKPFWENMPIYKIADECEVTQPRVKRYAYALGIVAGHVLNPEDEHRLKQALRSTVIITQLNKEMCLCACGSNKTVKAGCLGSKQRMFCNNCGHTFYKEK